MRFDQCHWMNGRKLWRIVSVQKPWQHTFSQVPYTIQHVLCGAPVLSLVSSIKNTTLILSIFWIISNYILNLSLLLLSNIHFEFMDAVNYIWRQRVRPTLCLQVKLEASINPLVSAPLFTSSKYRKHWHIFNNTISCYPFLEEYLLLATLYTGRIDSSGTEWESKSRFALNIHVPAW